MNIVKFPMVTGICDIIAINVYVIRSKLFLHQVFLFIIADFYEIMLEA